MNITVIDGFSKKNLRIREILDKIEALFDESEFEADDIMMMLDCLRVKYET